MTGPHSVLASLRQPIASKWLLDWPLLRVVRGQVFGMRQMPDGQWHVAGPITDTGWTSFAWYPRCSDAALALLTLDVEGEATYVVTEDPLGLLSLAWRALMRVAGRPAAIRA